MSSRPVIPDGQNGRRLHKRSGPGKIWWLFSTIESRAVAQTHQIDVEFLHGVVALCNNSPTPKVTKSYPKAATQRCIDGLTNSTLAQSPVFHAIPVTSLAWLETLTAQALAGFVILSPLRPDSGRIIGKRDDAAVHRRSAHSGEQRRRSCQ